MAAISLKVNGTRHDLPDVDPATPLLWVLRDRLGLTGTKFGCGVSQCGACTVHVNGRATRSCVLPVDGLDEAEITTIEGLSDDGDHAVQRAWEEHGVAQCGYCQAGQIMTAAAMLSRTPEPTDEDIDRNMGGHICRCGTYTRIRAAIHAAAKGAAR